jgi:hypothetical protein
MKADSFYSFGLDGILEVPFMASCRVTALEMYHSTHFAERRSQGGWGEHGHDESTAQNTGPRMLARVVPPTQVQLIFWKQ